jgi:circadian clock protein KaiC
VKWEPGLERSPDSWAWSVLEAIDEIRPVRLTIDAFTDVSRMFETPSRQTGFGLALSNALRKRGLTTIVNLELDSFVSQTVEFPVSRISPMIDSAILMRSVELNSSVRRMVSVMKHRQSWFDPTIREFSITRGGIQIGDQFEASRLLTGSAEPDGAC